MLIFRFLRVFPSKNLISFLPPLLLLEKDMGLLAEEVWDAWEQTGKQE